MSIRSLLNTTTAIRTEIISRTATGFPMTNTWVNKAENVPCRVTEQTPDRAAMIYGKWDATKQKRIYLDTDQSLSVKDQFVWSDNGSSQRYWVWNVENQGGHLNQLWAVDVATYPGT